MTFSKRFCAATFLALALVSTTGCATFIAAGPSTLDVTIDGPTGPVTAICTGVTSGDVNVVKGNPFKFVMDKSSPYAIALSRDGYTPQLIIVKTEAHPAYWLNIAPMMLALGATLLAPQSVSSSSISIILAAEVVSLVGMCVDLATKNGFRHTIQDVRVVMEKQTP
jgi:hypothetical protein